MNLALSNPVTIAQSASTSSSKFPSDSVSTHPAPDWRPGERSGKKPSPMSLTAFLQAQRENLLELRAALVDSMYIIAQDARDQVAGKSALSTHLDDAGSDAYDRDFALSLLAEGGNALLEIDAALGRIERGTYGICEMSGRRIPLARLQAVPFTRFTVECQATIEKRKKLSRPRQTFVSSAFSVADELQVDDEKIDTDEAA